MAKVMIVAYDDDGTELTTTINIDMGDAPQAIELWQSVRAYADKQALKIMRETAIVNLMKAFNISRDAATKKLDQYSDECPVCSSVGRGPLCKAHQGQTRD